MARTAKPALAVLGLFLLTACGAGGDEGSGGSPTLDQAEPGEASPEADSPENADAEETADAGGPQDATASMDDAVQTITYPMQGHDGEITMGLLAPEVEGDSMLVSVVFQPEFTDDTEEVSFRALHGSGSGGVLAPVVSDRQNLKAYHVPRETTNQHVQGGGWLAGTFAAGTWASAIGDVEVRSGEQYLHWAYFPAPEDAIDTVDVAVIPGAQEFRDVEIDWGDTEPGSVGTGETSEDDDDA